MANDPKKWRPAVYSIYFGILQDIAKQYGYALALHGSMRRDLDLVAIPWTEQTGKVEEMLWEFKSAVGFTKNALHVDGKPWDSIEHKPHGRIAYTIVSGTRSIDVSIIPTRPNNRKY